MPEDGIDKAADIAVKNPYWNPQPIERNGIRGSSFNTYGAGAYLVFRLYPQVRVGMDSRNDVYGEELYAEYRRALLDPEALREVLNRYFTVMRAVFESHGGTIEKIIGDAIVAVFGLPFRHDDDPLRAVEAAAESQRALATLNDELEQGYGVRLVVRTGIATGATFHPYEALAAASLVYRRGFAALGVTAKYDRQQYGSQVSDAWAGDIGLAIAVFDIMAMGVSVQNLGGDLEAEALLPRRTRAGITLNYTDPQGTLRLLTTLEGQWTRDRSAVLVQGLEVGVVRGGAGLIGRLGYSTRPAITAASHWTFGGGIVLGRLAVDYAFQSYGVLESDTHRVGLRWTP